MCSGGFLNAQTANENHKALQKNPLSLIAPLAHQVIYRQSTVI